MTDLTPIQRKLAEWYALRAELAALEAAERPNLTDRYGRVWVWASGTLYVHDQLAWPRDFILRDDIRLPSRKLADNPNYKLCDICTQEW